MPSSDEEMIAHALEMDAALLPYAAELLADFEELGSDPDRIVKAVGSLDLPAGSNVVDLGCGKGANSIALASVLGFRVLGIDLYAPFIDHCRRAAEAAAVSERCVFRQGNVAQLAGALQPADVVLFAALGDVLGPLDETMRLLRRYARPGGVIVVADAFLQTSGRAAPPGFENYAGLEQTRSKLTACGDVIVREVIDSAGGGDENGEDETGTARIRRRANEIARRHPSLTALLTRFAETQASACDYIAGSLGDAVWVVRRAAV